MKHSECRTAKQQYMEHSLFSPLEEHRSSRTTPGRAVWAVSVFGLFMNSWLIFWFFGSSVQRTFFQCVYVCAAVELSDRSMSRWRVFQASNKLHRGLSQLSLTCKWLRYDVRMITKWSRQMTFRWWFPRFFEKSNEFSGFIEESWRSNDRSLS